VTPVDSETCAHSPGWANITHGIIKSGVKSVWFLAVVYNTNYYTVKDRV